MIVAGAGFTDPQRLARLIERWLLKVRYVVEYPARAEGAAHMVVECSSPGDLPAKLPGVSLPDRLARLASQRIGTDHDFPVFVAMDDAESVLGYSFLFVPREAAWHDCLPSRVGEARATSSWVEERYRGQGVRGSLFSAQVAYCATRGLRLLAVIERTNEDSIRSSTKAGATVQQRNFLLKFLGRNLVSVTTNPVRAYILVGRRRTHR